MYQIFLDNNLIHNENIADLQIYDPSLTLEQNAVNMFEFTIHKTHPYYSFINRMKSLVKVYYESRLIFLGRVVEINEDTYKSYSIYCEETLGYFNDTILEPYNYQGSIEDYLSFLITSHNSQVDTYKQFKLGAVTVTDPNDYITRADTSYPNTLKVIKDKLINNLGGYIRVRYEDDGNYIDYLSDFTTLNSQEIKFGENMLSVKTTGSASDVATVIIPLGATDQATQEKLTIAEVNDGKIYVEDTEAIEKYGRIVKTVEYKDVTLASNLKTKAIEYLNSVKDIYSEIEISATDMAGVEKDIHSFSLWSKIHVISDFHGIDGYFTPLKLSINLFDPTSNTITLSAVIKTLTEGQINDIGMVVDKVENVYNDYQLGIENSVLQVLQEVSSMIDQSAEEIKMSVSESYYSKEDTDELLKRQETQWIQDKESFTFQFNEFKQDINEAINNSNAGFDDIRKYIRFINGDIELGQIGNEFLCRITKEKISFYQGTNEVAYFSNSALYVTAVRIITSLQIGDFIFQPRANGSLAFKHV